MSQTYDSTTDLGLQNFATITGIKGEQFDKEVFSAVLKFKDLDKFLKVFPEVQRQASGRKIGSIKNYILTGIETNDMRFFSALTVTTRGHVFFNEKTNRIAIDTNQSKLSINDGQHRFYGINAAIEELRRKKLKAKSEEQAKEFQRKLDKVENMIVPLVIFNNISEIEEKQLFYDLNNLASKPSRSATIRLSQNDNLSRLARELSEMNPYLIKYGVEMHKQLVHKNNPNTILLTTVYAMCKNLYATEFKANPDYISDDTYHQIKEDTDVIFSRIFKALPQDLDVKNKYILSKSFALRGIASFVNDATLDITNTQEDIYEAISKVNWQEEAISYWSAFNVVQGKNGSLEFPNHNEGGVSIVKQACLLELENIQNNK